MHRPGTTAVLDDQAGFEAESVQVAAVISPPGQEPRGAPIPVTMAGVPSGRILPCTDDPDLFFAESPQDVEQAKAMCRGCRARLACLAGAQERREPWGVWGGELLMGGTIVPRKRPRGRPRKDVVAIGAGA